MWQLCKFRGQEWGQQQPRLMQAVSRLTAKQQKAAAISYEDSAGQQRLAIAAAKKSDFYRILTDLTVPVER
ncbi:MAG: hypothetical protein EAZ61_00475 [Oscillatoriales cyanobacterium]|nr:MAG: hypothetical protein EAZ61_00475 [Oscillatoriales cyanobacterium]